MDENTKAFIEVGKKLHKDNEATLAELKKINRHMELESQQLNNKLEMYVNDCQDDQICFNDKLDQMMKDME